MVSDSLCKPIAAAAAGVAALSVMEVKMLDAGLVRLQVWLHMVCPYEAGWM